MISTSSASILPKSLTLITNAWAYEIAFSLYTYTHANFFIRIEISSNMEQRQYSLLGSFEKQGNSGQSS